MSVVRPMSWRPSPPDARDRAYLMDAPHARRALPQSKVWPLAHPVLDQQDRPHCVAYAWTAMLLASPVSGKLPGGTGVPALTRYTAGLYAAARQIDGLPDREDGTTVRAGAAVLKSRAMVLGYLWAYDADTVARYILSRGPVVLGLPWYAGMSAPGGGMMRRTGDYEGGHAVLAIGYSQPRKAFRILNSWGNSWAQQGRAWLPHETLQVLLREQGEACSAIEVPR